MTEGAKRRRREKIARRVKVIHRLKAGLGCAHCGERDPVCLTFHHVHRENKKRNVTAMAKSGYGDTSFNNELAKCILLCTNCHHKHHAREHPCPLQLVLDFGQ